MIDEQAQYDAALNEAVVKDIASSVQRDGLWIIERNGKVVAEVPKDSCVNSRERLAHLIADTVNVFELTWRSPSALLAERNRLIDRSHDLDEIDDTVPPT